MYDASVVLAVEAWSDHWWTQGFMNECFEGLGGWGYSVR